ncbi:MAG: DUF2231 domain-containing protein [Calditrichia bacterium]
MASGARLFGHPIHPPLTHFPVALWSISLVWDILALWLGEAIFWHISFWSIAAGLLFALPASITGLIEFMNVPVERKAAQQTATWHMMAVMLAASVYAASLFLRGSVIIPPPEMMFLILAVSLFGFLALQVGGWLGGHLVYHHRIGLNKSEDSDETPE